MDPNPFILLLIHIKKLSIPEFSNEFLNHTLAKRTSRIKGVNGVVL